MYSIKTVKTIFIGFVFLFLLWFAAAATDLIRLNSFEMPVFARPAELADDGGSGTYKGFGWHIEIEGNFMPEDELPGITQYEFYLMDDLIHAAIRD